MLQTLDTRQEAQDPSNQTAIVGRTARWLGAMTNQAVDGFTAWKVLETSPSFWLSPRRRTPPRRVLKMPRARKEHVEVLEGLRSESVFQVEEIDSDIEFVRGLGGSWLVLQI